VGLISGVANDRIYARDRIRVEEWVDKSLG
jgi:hypothetical protein